MVVSPGPRRGRSTAEAWLEIVRQAVDRSTFSRGAAYAREGAVLSHQWSGTTRVDGTVRGSGPAPYQTTVLLRRGAGGQAVHVEGDCNCPMGFDCKHVVALALTAGPTPTSPGGPGARRPRALPAWERVLAPVVAEPEPEPTGDTGRSLVGLQFEVVTGGPQLRRGNGAAAGLRLRPVLPGRNSSWVRTGIDWSSLDYVSYRTAGREPPTAEQIALLKELRSMGASGGTTYYARRGDEHVWFEEIDSPRLWALLVEAGELGVDLVVTGGPGSRVDLHPAGATPHLDVRRTPEGLVVRPRLEVDGTEVPHHPETTLLVGSPVHGVAWWSGGAAPHLQLAPLTAVLDAPLADLVVGEPLLVPSGDEERFLSEFHPVLAERMVVRSDDGSVDLPEPAPWHLELTLRSTLGTSLEFAWSWRRGRGGTGPRRSLWTPPRSPEERRAEVDLVAEVTALVAEVPGCVETGPRAGRLVARGDLHGMAAADLVTGVVPALAALGGVEVRIDGELPEFREADGPPVVSLQGAGTSKERDWFDLMVTVTVDGESVPFQSLFVALAGGETHLLLPSGTYFPLDSDELRRLAALITEARSLGEREDGSIRVNRFQASWWEEIEGLGVLDAQAAAWQQSVLTLLDPGDEEDVPVPVGLDADLREYQVAGFRWLVRLHDHGVGGVLADDMGLGKTVQALALVGHVHERQPDGPPFLVVAPTSVVQNWAAETRKFAPGLEVVTIGETSARRGVPLEKLVHGAHLVITSYGLFRREFEAYQALDWAGLFLDEAQFVKNHASLANRRARMLTVPYKVALTGTPFENNLTELWSLLAVVAPGLLGDRAHFAAEYAHPIERSGDADRLDRLRRRIRPLMLRRTKEQVAADLPPKLEQILDLELVPRHARIYQTYLQRERQKVLGMLGDLDRHRFEILTSLTRLRQAALAVGLVDPKHDGVPSTKLDVLMEMVEEVVADGHKVLVFSQFTTFLRMARARLEEAGVDLCYLDGRTRNRVKVIDRFQEGEVPVFLVSLKAGGFGLNLTAADYCILLDPWWNPATEAQAVDRTHRIGQDKKVMVYRLVAKGTIEEKVMALKEKKAALFANVIDSGELTSGALTAEDIRSMLE